MGPTKLIPVIMAMVLERTPGIVLVTSKCVVGTSGGGGSGGERSPIPSATAALPTNGGRSCTGRPLRSVLAPTDTGRYVKCFGLSNGRRSFVTGRLDRANSAEEAEAKAKTRKRKEDAEEKAETFWLNSRLSPGRVQATDPDCGVNAMVNYTLAAGRVESEQLMVRSDTGDICGGLSTVAIVRVQVTDVNDNRPVFEPQKYNVTLKSDSPVQGPILRLVATDLDAGLFGQVAYRITNGNEAGVFHIDRNTGELQVARPSLLSRSSLHQLNVTATDAAGLKSIVDVEVRITVSSPGHRIASCEKPRYTLTVKETTPQNSLVGGVKEGTASSLSPGERPTRFYLAKEEPDLTMDPNTGMLRIRLPLDRETRDKYILSVEARNGVSAGYCQIELNVEDANDNPPIFLTSTVRISVPESHPLHTTLYVAHATDPDTTPTLPIRYVLGQNSNDLFGIDARSGELYLARRLDYETQQRHGLLIRALDGAGLSANLSLSVEVQDVNDNPPVFERNEYHVEVPEGAKLDSQILQVTAVDLDTGNNARLSYRLQGSSAFRISPNTGWIYLAQTLDRETLDRHALTVLATDNGSPAATASASVLVTVLDDNDNDPRFERDFYGFELLENLPSGTLVGSVSASDSDLGKNALLRYAVVQPNSSFAVDPDTGEISTREPLDRETKSVHELVLEARDQGTPSRAVRVPLKVTVLDVNDNSPEIVDPQGDVVSVREEQPPGTEVARVRALDTDLGENATVTYSILKDRDSDGYNVFTIDPITGMIRTKAVLDHEERNVYRVSVKATDAGRPPRHSVRALRVEVLALADNRPTFTSSSLTFNVREDASIGHAVGSVSGAGPAGRVAFTLDSLTPISEFPAFDVDRSSGQLVVAHSLDRENVSEYHLEIRALDTTSIGNPQSIAVSVKIVIEDANDNPPRWPQDPIPVRVSEKAVIGSTVYNLTATDLDSGLNGELRYGLVAEIPSKGSFAVDSLTGALTLTKPLDREERAEYTLILRASDRASPGERLASTVTARIIVLDQNDNDPVFVAPESTKVPVTPDLLPGATLVRVVAVDKDAGDNGRVSYVITSANEEARFSVGYESGIVSLERPMARSTELEITANDHGSPPRKSTLRLTLTLLASGQTNGPPRLLLANPVARVSEDLQVGAPILNVAGSIIVDQGNISFSIPSNVASDKFAVSPNGLVTLRGPLNREETSLYSVPILARSSKLLDISTLQVLVMDENDNSPEFRAGSCYTLAVPENQETAVIHTIAATDLDEGKNGEIYYSIVGGNIGAKFILDPVTGMLSMSHLDRETVSKYALTISAKDRGRPSLEARCNLTVIVLDVNDNAPAFAQNQYTESRPRGSLQNVEYPSFGLPSGFPYASSNYPTNYHPAKYAATISEDVAPDSSVMSVRATDPDQGVNGKITYSIAEETSWLFRVDNLTGVITTAGPLDRERRSSYNFVVVATDSGKYAAKSTSIPVEIRVSDVNDNTPVFAEFPFRARVSIGTQPEKNILRVVATDADEGLNGEIVYSFLHEQEKPKFRIHPSTGAVTAALSLSQDNGKTYHLEVLARDRGNPSKSARGLIELQVGDPADLSPVLKFQNETYEVAIQENSPAGTEVVQVTAVRSDGRRQHVSYSLGSGNDFGTFAIDEDTGMLRVNDPTRLDAELWTDMRVKPTEGQSEDGRTNSWARSLEGQLSKEEPRECSKHVLAVVARTTGSDPLEAYVKVVVGVSDVNDNPPVFTQTQYSATVLEGNVKGDFVVKLSASDADQGVNSRILYHIVDGNPDNAFTISPPYSGIVRTNIVLDREIREKYRLTIIATDQGNPQLTGTAALSVRVIDINDNQPTFPEHSIISVSEGTAVGTVLTTVTANDVDSSPALTYRFGNVTNPGPFSIDRYGGKVVLRRRLDAETRSEYSLQVMASDGIHEAITNLIVRVTDLNDNTPRLQQSAYITTLPGDRHALSCCPCSKLELTPRQDKARKREANREKEKERRKEGRQRWRRKVDDRGGGVGTDEKLAARTAKGSVNEGTEGGRETHEKERQRRQGVRLTAVWRGGYGEKRRIANASHINKREDTVCEAAEKPPSLQPPAEITGFEDSRNLLKIHRPAPNGAFGWAVEGRIVYFAISEQGRRVNPVIIKIVLRCPETAEYTFWKEEGINEEKGESSANFGAAEGRGDLQEILTVNATDDDLTEENSRVRYYLLKATKGFSVHPVTGVLTVNRTAIPRPLPKEVELAVVAEDYGKPPASSVCSIVVRLSSLKSTLPGKEYKITVKENSSRGTILMRLSDVDLLDGSIVAGDDSGTFEASRGELILSKVLDRETKDRYVLRLGSKNQNMTTGSLAGDEPITVIVTVEDANDNYPRFLEELHQVSIKENAARGTVVAILQAKDDDLAGSAAANLLYEITSGNDAGLFRVEKTTGAVLVNATLDCDLEPEIYNLVVMACDSDPVSPLCALTRLRIRLEDVNDNSPKFPVSEYLEFVGENEPIGTTVFSARASDLDRGIFGSLNYSIVSAAATGFSDIDDSWKLFAVDGKSGTVTTRAVFDYELRNRYAFTLRATDTGGRAAAVRVRVEIESRDEFYPQFTERMYRFGIRSGARILPGTVIGHVTATDRDKGPDGRVVYQLTSQHPYFKLNRTTGSLIVKQKLIHIDMDVEESSRLVVSASSGRQGSLSNMTVVEITLMDDNDINEARGATALATPNDVGGSNMAVAASGGLADWALGLLIALLLLVVAFGAVFLYLHLRNRRHKKPGTKPGLNGESNATASNSYVDPSAFDTIPIRSVAGVGSAGNGGSGNGNGGGGAASCQFAPPKYDEIPPYGTSGQSGQQQTTSELSGSDQSGSSGRGSAEDDGEDEEIRMINEGQQTGDSASDLSVHNTQEYLARLGIVDPPAGTPRRPPEALPLDSLHLFEDEAATEADIATLIYGKIGESGRPMSGLEVPGGPSMNGSLSSIVHSEEELTGSYNWDYLLDWGPHYQPLAHVFSEIARLKDDAASVQSGNSGSSGKTKSVHKAPPPPLLTSVAPRSLAAPALARGILPRSPISHDASTFPSAALSPSFSPSLSPLATRSPSISPLVPPATQRSSQSANRGIPVTDAELRI
ncbi:Protein dachsous [Dufourea novaeangliae]|uniref:Protein dachsous n=1 Tax=Dufourea novaeangliae TaxID=178035 RepID=A0A154PRZ0_DUFNO|nr:Protein dachsous [Dufourea novaeangliae]